MYLRGIFGSILEKISNRYDVPPIYVEWLALLICWILWVIFEPSPFSSFDLILLIFFYIASILIYLIASVISGGNLSLIKDAFKKPSIAEKEFQNEINDIIKEANSKKSKKK